MGITAELIGLNFIEPIGQTSVQICKVGADEYKFGFINDINVTLFEDQHFACFESLSLNELVELKNSINKLIQVVEAATKQTNS